MALTEVDFGTLHRGLRYPAMWKIGAIGLVACATAAADPLGRWSMNLDVHYSANPTTEQLIEHSVMGAAWVELASDGTVTGCLGRTTREFSAQGHCEASDHKDHHQSSDHQLLLALGGTWTASATGFDLLFTAASGDSCKLGAVTSDPQLALHCTAVGSAIPAPAGTVVCTNPAGGNIDGLGLAFVSPSRAMQRVPNPSGPSLLLARTPGLLVVSTRRNNGPAILAISAGAAALNEAVLGELVKRR